MSNPTLNRGFARQLRQDFPVIAALGGETRSALLLRKTCLRNAMHEGDSAVLLRIAPVFHFFAESGICGLDSLFFHFKLRGALKKNVSPR